eukprot:TRINITY_DN348_c0_g1_i2.p1 TRINITY_DN348_c0_g1~~TRINITY_DN348_c0_g1_i2.p1  ORF type:complete len:281 (+),score=18.86 TRINITY_DN348_c0_g1_i2:70-912(+)
MPSLAPVSVGPSVRAIGHQKVPSIPPPIYPLHTIKPRPLSDTISSLSSQTLTTMVNTSTTDIPTLKRSPVVLPNRYKDTPVRVGAQAPPPSPCTSVDAPKSPIPIDLEQRLVSIYQTCKRRRTTVKDAVRRIIGIDIVTLGEDVEVRGWVEWAAMGKDAGMLVEKLEAGLRREEEDVPLIGSPPLFAEVKRLRKGNQTDTITVEAPLSESTATPSTRSLVSSSTPSHHPFTSCSNWFEDALVADLDIREEESLYTMTPMPPLSAVNWPSRSPTLQPTSVH